MPLDGGPDRFEDHVLLRFAPHNRAAQLSAHVDLDWNADRIDEIRSRIDDHFSISSNRTVAAAGDNEGAAAIVQMLSIHEFFPNCRFEAIAERCDDLMLMRWHLWSDGGDEMEMVVVCQVNDSSLLQRSATFDADAVEAARVLLDRWAVERAETR